MSDFLGIDYGSKLAGTTVICFLQDDKLQVVQSEKKKDADRFILEKIEKLKPAKVFIDAPLSLPKGYFEDNSEEYFYRACDREVSAMSPMFLGGLTARAVALKSELQKQDVDCFEVYPGHLARKVLKFTHYEKKVLKGLSVFQAEFEKHLPFPFKANLKNWHQVDATLAWLSGWRFLNGEAEVFGEEVEGRIWV